MSWRVRDPGMLIRHLPCNGHPDDVSGHGGATSWVGTPAYTPDLFGRTAARCTAGNYVSIADHADIKFGTTDFSLTTWFRYTTTLSNRIVISKKPTAPHYLLILLTATSRFRFDIKDGVNNCLVYSNATVVRDHWYHIACVARRGDASMFYQDGELTGGPTSNVAVGDISNDNSLFLGGGAPEVNPSLDMFDFRLFNVALTQDEINQGIIHRPKPYQV